MPHIHAFDLRYSPTLRVLQALSEGLRKVQDDFDEAERSDESYFDVDTALEYADNLCGIAFVATQTYITGTVSDVRLITGAKQDKGELLRRYSVPIPGIAITQLQFCDAMANYFKHRDEWVSWENKTAEVLLGVGITEDESYPCVVAARMLVPADDADLTPFIQMLSTWRQAVIGAYETAPDSGD